MTESASGIGSLWRRWDLHLHAPGTKLSNGFGESDESTLKTYVEKLEASEVQAFGITDYFSFDSYFAVAAAYQAAFPGGTKLFMPNIEFRLTETISKDARHVQTLFEPKGRVHIGEQPSVPSSPLPHMRNVLQTSCTGCSLPCSSKRPSEASVQIAASLRGDLLTHRS